MRTNTIDATAFRCLQEFTNMMNVYSKLLNKNHDFHIILYLGELVACDTAKQMRDLHNERMKNINTRIDEHLEKNKSKEDPQQKIKIGKTIKKKVLNVETLSESDDASSSDEEKPVNFSINNKANPF